MPTLLGRNHRHFSTMNPINNAIKDFESKSSFKFCPNRDFYNRIGINQKRYSKFLKGEIDNITIKEVLKISDFFKQDSKKFLKEITEFIKNKK